MPIGRRGLIVPQNTFLEDVIRRSDGLRKYTLILNPNLRHRLKL